MPARDRDSLFFQAFRKAGYCPLSVEALARLAAIEQIGPQSTSEWATDATRRGIVDRQGEIVALTAAGERAAIQESR